MHSHSWPEISFSEPDNWQTTSCVSLLSTPHHLRSYDLFPVIAMFNYGLSQFDSRGEENKAQIYPSSQTASCLESTDPPPMAAPPTPSFVVLRRRGKWQKSILTWFLKCFFFSHLHLRQRLPNWVLAAWVVVVSMATLDQLNTSTEGDT